MADGSPSTFRILFKEPLEIQQGEYYVASAKLKVVYSSDFSFKKKQHLIEFLGTRFILWY